MMFVLLVHFGTLRKRMKSSLMVRESDCQCNSCNGPVLDPSIRWHSRIWGAADEAVLNTVRKKIQDKGAVRIPILPILFGEHKFLSLWSGKAAEIAVSWQHCFLCLLNGSHGRAEYCYDSRILFNVTLSFSYKICHLYKKKKLIVLTNWTMSLVLAIVDNYLLKTMYNTCKLPSSYCTYTPKSYVC